MEEATDDTMTAATYWRNKTVEERLGVTIGQINQVGGWSKYQAWNDTLRNAVQTETHDFDASMIYAGCASSLAIEGCYMDMNKLDMISLDNPGGTRISARNRPFTAVCTSLRVPLRRPSLARQS